MILKKGNKLYSILTGNCPKCHQDFMYKNSNAYQLTQTLEMHERLLGERLKDHQSQ